MSSHTEEYETDMQWSHDEGRELGRVETFEEIVKSKEWRQMLRAAGECDKSVPLEEIKPFISMIKRAKKAASK